MEPGLIWTQLPATIIATPTLAALNSYANPIRVAPPVSSHEYSNASKFNPQSADFRCIQAITLLKRKIKKYIFPVGYSKGQSVCVSQNVIKTLLFCQRMS